MYYDNETPAVLPATPEAMQPENPEAASGSEMPLSQFLADFGGSLFQAVTEQNRPLYQGQTYPETEHVLDTLARPLFAAQREVVRAVLQLLLREDRPAAVINAEMGTGKTMMSIAAAAAMHHQGCTRTLVLSPPHLVYKWRREILKTVPEARVWVLNGTDTLAKLLHIRRHSRETPTVPEFFVLGRVRMRMGYHWRPAYAVRYRSEDGVRRKLFCCPKCGSEITDAENQPYEDAQSLTDALSKNRLFCRAKRGKGLASRECGEPLWTLCRKEQNGSQTTVYERVI